MTIYTYAVFDAVTDELMASLSIEGPASGVDVLRFAAFECGELFDRPHYLTTGFNAPAMMRLAGYPLNVGGTMNVCDLEPARDQETKPDPKIGQVWMRNGVQIRVTEIGEGYVRLDEIGKPRNYHYVPRFKWPGALIFVCESPVN